MTTHNNSEILQKTKEVRGKNCSHNFRDDYYFSVIWNEHNGYWFYGALWWMRNVGQPFFFIFWHFRSKCRNIFYSTSENWTKRKTVFYVTATEWKRPKRETEAARVCNLWAVSLMRIIVMQRVAFNDFFFIVWKSIVAATNNIFAYLTYNRIVQANKQTKNKVIHGSFNHIW